MGYEESLIPVENLSEVIGINRAIEGSEELKTLEYLVCYCAARARKPLFRGGIFGRPLSDVSPDERPIIQEGDLFAVVGGARLYQYDHCIWIDSIAGIDEGYETLFEDIPLKEIREQFPEDSQSAITAERKIRQHLNHMYEFAMHGKHPIELPDEFK